MALSVVVITLNEEHNLAECLGGLAWADETIVVDCGSTDATVALAQALGARVVPRRFTDFSDQKNFALDQATSDWVLSLDADERVTPALAAEMRQALADPGQVVGFVLRRHNRFLGRWLQHGPWAVEPKLRLIRRGSGRWQGNVHEVLVAEGPVGCLSAPLLHYASGTIDALVRRIDCYSTLEAQAWHDQGVRPSLWRMILYPPALFAYAYFLRLGMLDGVPGLMLSLLMAYNSFLKRAKLWELSLSRTPGAAKR